MAYGRRRLSVDVPEHLEVLELKPPVVDMRPDDSAVERALRSPMSARTLEKAARDAGRVLVVVPDKTRSSGAAAYLPPVLGALERAGLDPAQIKLITANGAHPPMSEDELVAVVGTDIRKRYAVYQHDAKDPRAVVHVGATSRGTHVKMNRLCVESDLVVLTGSVSFHYFAGFGGGRKTLFPGLAAYDSIVANHRLTLGPGEGLDARCGAGMLEGNPVHEDIMEAFSLLPPPYVLNTVVAPGGSVVGAFAGDHDPVFESVCGATVRAFSVSVDRGADLVIASCGGFPWDINLLQMHKSLRNAALAARDGAPVVMVGEGGQGVGSPTLERGLANESWRAADSAARRSYVLNAHTAVALLQQAARVSFHVVSRIRDLSCARHWAEHHPDPQSALEAAMEECGVGSPLVYYMPLSGITVPLMRP